VVEDFTEVRTEEIEEVEETNDGWGQDEYRRYSDEE
jgi:hypothetical protein